MTSATAGNKWRVHFTPDEIGEWEYTVDFKKGKWVAIRSRSDRIPSGFYMDGETGVFSIEVSDKAERDFRAHGRLQYVGERYLQFAETGQIWIQENFPDLFYIVSTGGILYSADPKLREEAWLNTNVRFDHGPLGALCPLRHGVLGGADSETFLGLIPNGLSIMEHPDWGGWGGRFRKQAGSQRQWIDLESNLIPEALGNTISRWAPHLQNDYQARMDWCVKPFDEANHPPTPVLDGDHSLRFKEITATPGQQIKLDSRGSKDIDGDRLSYEWKFFPEAGTYPGEIKIANSKEQVAELVIPEDAQGKTLHVLLILTDDGAPPLTRYRRLVIHCE